MINVTDVIGDFLTRIRNAYLAGNKSVKIPLSKLKFKLAVILKKEGYIYSVSIKNTFFKRSIYKNIDIILNVKMKDRLLMLKRISKPSKRVYCKAKNIPVVKNGLGICVLSTSSGIMSGHEAVVKNIGGEVLFFVF